MALRWRPIWGRIQTCFEAALGLFGPLHSILEEALVRVYVARGWQLADIPVQNASSTLQFPTMSDFAGMLEQVASSERKYKGDVAQNIEAAISGRIRPLTKCFGSSKGFLFDTEKSWPPPKLLFNLPVIFELNDLNSEARALASMLLLVVLREFREAEAIRSPEGRVLRHVCVIEEAHNVMGRTKPKAQGDSGTPNTEHGASEAFTDLLAEVRALGQGIIIADQSPNKLSPDAIRNTNLQIAHHIRSGDDRATLASSMVMTTEQETYLSKLQPGHAGLYYTGLHRATFVKVPEYSANGSRGGGTRDTVSDVDVRKHMQTMPTLPMSLCKHCSQLSTCPFRWTSRRILADTEMGESSYRNRLVNAIKESETWDVTFDEIGIVIRNLLDRVEIKGAEIRKDLAWCILLHFSEETMLW